jgi:GTP cyclohydrolase I
VSGFDRIAALEAERQLDLVPANGHVKLTDVPEVQLAVIQKAVRTILEAIGEDPNREGLLETPKRVARAYLELFAGYTIDPESVFTTFDGETYDSMVIVKDIPFTSFCEHHMLPFTGVAHIGYVPDGRIVGLSKMGRLLDIYAKRLQVQERLTCQIADSIEEHLQPLGVMVVIEATHSCMCMRGIKKEGSATVTSAVRGVFLDDAKHSKAEFLAMIK